MQRRKAKKNDGDLTAVPSAKKHRSEPLNLLSLPLDILKIILCMLNMAFLPFAYVTCKTFQRLIPWGCWSAARSMTFLMTEGKFEMVYYAATKWKWSICSQQDLMNSAKSGIILSIPKSLSTDTSFVAYLAVTTDAIPNFLFQRHRNCVQQVLMTLLLLSKLDDLERLLHGLAKSKCWTHKEKRTIANRLVQRAATMNYPSVCHWLWSDSPISGYTSPDVSALLITADYSYFLNYTLHMDKESITKEEWNSANAVYFGNAGLLVAERIEELQEVRLQFIREKFSATLLPPALEECRKNYTTGFIRSIYLCNLNLIRFYHERCGSVTLPIFEAESRFSSFSDSVTPAFSQWLLDNVPEFFASPERIFGLIGKSVSLNEWVKSKFPLIYKTNYGMHNVERSYAVSSPVRLEAVLHYYMIQKEGPQAENLAMIGHLILKHPRLCSKLWKKYGLDTNLFHEWALWATSEPIVHYWDISFRVINELYTAFVECLNLGATELGALKSTCERKLQWMIKVNHPCRQKSEFTEKVCECIRAQMMTE